MIFKISELKIEGLTKHYGKKLALNNFSARFSNGVYGILGPNGAGKTFFNSENIKKSGTEYFSHIGFLPQSPRFYKYYKCYEFMLYMSALKGFSKSEAKKRSEELLKWVNLWDVRDKKIGAFSGGMRQRLGIAQAMINNPDVLILDEPTAGLDPKERIRFRNIISRLSSDRIVLLATHIVPDIEYIANEVVLIKEGVKLSQDKPSALIDSIDGKVFLQDADDEKQVNEFMQKFSISNAFREDGRYKLRIVSDTPPSPSAVTVAPNLEDVYLYYFGENEC